jgi:hypothetical protein
MTGNTPDEEMLVDQAIDWLNATLGNGFKAERQLRTVAAATTPGGSEQIDGLITLTAQNNQATFSVEAKRSFTPRGVERLLDNQQRFAKLANINLLLVASWLSPRAREIIAGRGANYLDLTGNCLIRLDYPPMFVRVDGAAKDPAPATRTAGLRGPKAGRLVRVLTEVRPPYGVRELAEKSALTPGYVSRLLETLDRDALVQREVRGRVTTVDYVGLIKRYAGDDSMLNARGATTFIAPGGAVRALEKLAELSTPTAVTGSFAAARIAPVAAPALLAIYALDARAVAESLRLLPANAGADVVLLVPRDPVVWDRTDAADGADYVAPAQAALDCLTGNGRMPSEGLALLDWMSANEDAWRASSLTDLPRYGDGPVR